MVTVAKKDPFYLVVETTQGGYHVMNSRVEQLSTDYVDEVYDGRGGVDFYGPFYTEEAALFFESLAIVVKDEPNPFGSGNMTIQVWEGVSRKPWTGDFGWTTIHTIAAEAIVVEVVRSSTLALEWVKCPIMANVQQKGLKAELERLAAIANAQNIPENWRPAVQNAKAALLILEVLSQIFDDAGTATAFGWVMRMIAFYVSNRTASGWQKVVDENRILRIWLTIPKER